MGSRGPITAELRELMGGAEPRVDEDGVVTAKYVTPEAWGEFVRCCDAIDAVHAGLERENAELHQRVAALDKRDDSMHIGGSITDELREWVRDGKGSLLAIADRIDAEHAQLEHDYKVACEVNERQDEQYADMVHKLDRAYEKNRNQRRQLTEVQEALHRRNEGELKRRWMREKQDLELQIAKMRLKSVELPKDADGEVIRVGDELDGYGKTIEVVEMRYGRSGWVLISMDGNGYADCAAFVHHHAPTVKDVLTKFGIDWEYEDNCEDRAALLKEYAAKLRLAGDAE